jgi:outer membrane protein assembly factor BamB
MARKSAGMVVVVALALAGCGSPEPKQTDLLYLQSGHTVSIVAAGDSREAFRAVPAVPSHDWSTVVRATRLGKSTRVVALDPSTGREVWARRAAGRLGVKAVSSDGNAAVLEPKGGRYLNNPTRTTFVIARRGSSAPEVIELKGNFAPEAFSTDTQSLFVVQYLPARNPDRYQVRRLDLGTGEVGDVFSVDAELQEAMRGTARIQAMSPDGTRLYTLYTLRNRGTSYAFIHVLSLDELWAHCVDLPEEFATAPQKVSALTVTPDGRHLYVANGRERMLAEVDTEELAVTRTATADFANGVGAHAVQSSASTLYLAGGTKVSVVDTEELEIVHWWEVDGPITGLQTRADDTSLYVGNTTAISVYDPASGKSLGHVDPPGGGAVGRLGPVTRGLEPARTEIVCAC